MSIARRSTAALSAVIVALGAAAALASPGVPGAADGLVRTRAVLPGLAHARALGAVPSGTRLRVTLGLAHPDPLGEQALYRSLYDPADPSYRHFLSPEEYRARFGVPRPTVAATETWLRSGGLTGVTSDDAGDLVSGSGTTSQLARLLHTRFASFAVGTVRFIANTVAPAVPAALPVTAVLGLDTLHRSYTPSQVRAVNAANGVPDPTPHAAGPYTGILTPQNLWGVYDLPDTNMGQGETAGLFMEGYADSITANLRVYERRHHLPQVPVRVVRAGSGDDAAFGDNTDAVEWYLDSDAITGMAPKLRQLSLYTGTNLFDTSVATTFAAWADDPRGPKQMNASFGECEASPGNPVLGPLAQPPFYYGSEAGDQLEAAAEPVLMHANLEGRTLFASTGDTGGSCPAVVVPVLGAGNGVTPQPLPEQNYPAASPHVTAVAGTVERTQGRPAPMERAQRADERGWTYSGGGSSFYIAEPDYQKKVAAVNRPCVSRPDGTPYPPGTLCRGVADIADMSGTVTSYALDSGTFSSNFYDIEADMSQGSNGGTSLSSPLAVGMWSRVQAGAPTAKGLGFANETFYRIGLGPHYHRDFYDVTQSETQGGNFYYQAGPGWDYVSGWGAMDVRNLLRDVDHRLTPRNPAGPPVPPMTLVGCSTVTSPLGNANDALNPGTKDPSLDITRATLRPSGENLVVTLSGPTLSTTPPAGSGGEAFYETWTVGERTYFARASVDGQGGVSYSDGISDAGGYTPIRPITGSFAEHKITMSVPLADVGHPGRGAVLAYPYAFAQYALSGPTPATNPLYFTEDVATAGQPALGVVLGKSCRG